MASYQAKNDPQLSRQLKVQKMTIPFVIVGNATPASVAVSNDEPSIMFIRTAGVDQITAALASGEVATYSVAPVDATGIFNILVRIQEPVDKIQSCKVFDRVNGAVEATFLGSASGVTTGSGGGQSIMLTCDVTVSLAAANTVNGSLELEYSVLEHS